MLVVILTENCGFEIHYILCHYDWWSKFITRHNLTMYHAVPRLTMRTKSARKEITYLTLRRPYLGLECRGLRIPQTRTFWKNSRLTKQTGPRVDSWVMNANVPSFIHFSASLYHLSLKDGICHHDGLNYFCSLIGFFNIWSRGLFAGEVLHFTFSPRIITSIIVLVHVGDVALQGLDGPEMSSKHFEAMLRTGWVVFGGVKGSSKNGSAQHIF